MDIGKRNHQLVIKKPVTVTTLGVPVTTENIVATVWASKKPMNQKRALENGVMNLDGTTIFNILYYDYPTLDKSCIVYEGINKYVIQSIVPREKVDFDIIVNSNG